jgi:hypothetical protein
MEGRPQGLPISFHSLDDVAIHVSNGLLEQRKGDVPADVHIRDMFVRRLIKENVALKMVRCDTCMIMWLRYLTYALHSALQLHSRGHLENCHSSLFWDVNV